MRERGVLYIVSGERHQRQAAMSARSVRRTTPSVPATLITNGEPPAEVRDAFDEVETDLGPFDKGARIDALRRTPYEQTLHLDSDTLAIEPLDDFFGLLEQYDVVAAPAPVSAGPADPDGRTPASFGMINSGVLAFGRGPAVDRWIPEWRRLFDGVWREMRGEGRMDQPPLRWALWRTRTSVYVLTQEHNVRARFPVYLRSKPVIVHEAGVDLEDLAGVYAWTDGPRHFGPQAASRYSDVHESVRRVGVWADVFTHGALSGLRPRVVVEAGATDGAHSAFFSTRYPSARVLTIARDERVRDALSSDFATRGSVRVVGAGCPERVCARNGIDDVCVLAVPNGAQVPGPWIERSVGVVISERGAPDGFESLGAEVYRRRPPSGAGGWG